MFYSRQQKAFYYSFSKGDPRANAIRFPQEISLHGEHRKRTLNTIACIYKKTKQFPVVVLDFSRTKKIRSEAMILIYASLQNAINIASNFKFRCANVSNIKVKQVLKQIGIYALCCQKCTIRPSMGDVVKWRVCCGVDVISEKFDAIVDPETELQQLPPEIDLYGGCIEATKNVGRHAYINADGTASTGMKNNGLFNVAHEKTSWWCFSQVKDATLCVVVCDLGLSIPHTLPTKRPKLFDYIKSMRLKGQNISDAELIKNAVETPSSRSGEDYRGNGLPRIAEIASSSGGTVGIYSRHGSFFIKKDGTMLTLNDQSPIYGTVITWTLPLGSEQ